MVLLKDIAQSVGCDISTVSRVLNNRPNRVSAENRQLIQAAARKLGYVANRTASSLARGATGTVGVLVPNVFDGVFAEYIEALDLEFSAAGYALRPFICHNRQDKENAALDALLHHEVDAMISIYYSPEHNASLYETIRQNQLPLIFRCTDEEIIDRFDLVLMDIYEGYQALAEHLLAAGCRRIGVVGGPIAEALRQNGGGAGAKFFRQALTAAGLPVSGDNAIVCDDSQDGARQAVRQRFTRQPRAFDGLIVQNINKVFGCCKALYDVNLRIPQDVKIATISDLPICRMYPVPLTVWAQPVPEICRKLVRLTVNRLRQPDSPLAASRIQSTLIARESTQLEPGKGN